jgi:hypothetical protein
MVKCKLCGEDLFLPHWCKYCGDVFCVKHTLPENHNCPDVPRGRWISRARSIQNTLLYTQLVNFESDDFHSATAQTVQEAQKFVEAGFEYVCDFTDVKLFRKRK